MQLLIIGATGNIGSEIAHQLHDYNLLPRIGARDVQAARQRFGDKATYAEFDFTKPSTYPAALRDIDRLFFVAPLHEVAPVSDFLEAARRSGVRRVVFSSGRTTGDIPHRPLHRMEEAVHGSGIPWIILRPGWFMQNFTDWLWEIFRREGVLYLPIGDARTAFVDVRDVAAVAIHCLLEQGHEGQTYDLTSDESFTHGQVIDLINRAAGRDFRYESVSEEEYIQLLRGQGWKREAAEETAFLFRLVREGKEAAISPNVERLLHRPPRRLAAFIEEHARTWRTINA